MRIEVMLSSTENLLEHKGKLVKVVPKLTPLKIKFKLRPKKGCGPVARKV